MAAITLRVAPEPWPCLEPAVALFSHALVAPGIAAPGLSLVRRGGVYGVSFIRPDALTPTPQNSIIPFDRLREGNLSGVAEPSSAAKIWSQGFLTPEQVVCSQPPLFSHQQTSAYVSCDCAWVKGKGLASFLLVYATMFKSLVGI